MGAFFTNVLVRSAGGVDAVEAAISQVFKADGWERTTGEGCRLARRVLLVPADDWVAVYDQGTETQNVEVLERLASDLSGFLGAAAVSTLVNDSDYLLFQIFEAGDTIGFAERGPDGVVVNEGGLGSWRHVFPNAKRVVAALKKQHMFVEPNLRELAEALGLPADAVSTGFKYLVDEIALDHRLLAYSPMEPAPPKNPHVAPVHADELVAKQGTSMEWHATFRNHGSAFTGLTISVHQPQGLLSVGQVRVVVGGGRAATSVARPFASPHDLSQSLTVDFDDVALPEGAPRKHLNRLKLIGFGEWAEVAMPTIIEIHLTLVPAKAGSGRLFVSATPLGTIATEQHNEECTVS